MASEAQISANRANAQKSTGPRTPAGKAVASQNAVTHGFLARDTVLQGEDAGEFAVHRDRMLRDLAPAGDGELDLAAAAGGTAPDGGVRRAVREDGDGVPGRGHAAGGRPGAGTGCGRGRRRPDSRADAGGRLLPRPGSGQVVAVRAADRNQYVPHHARVAGTEAAAVGGRIGGDGRVAVGAGLSRHRHSFGFALGAGSARELGSWARCPCYPWAGRPCYGDPEVFAQNEPNRGSFKFEV